MSTWNGIEQFDGYSFNNYKAKPYESVGLYNHRIKTLRKSGLNNLWCLMADYKVYLFNTKTLKYEDVFRYNRLKGNDNIKKIITLKKGIAWIIGDKNKLYRVDENTYTKEGSLIAVNFAQNEVYNITQDCFGNEWLLTDKGIFIYGKGILSNRTPFKFITEIFGKIYIASENSAIYQYDRKKNQLIKCLPTIPTNNIQQLCKLNNGHLMIWLDKGFIDYNTITHSHCYKATPGISFDKFYQDCDNNVWILSHEQQILRYNPKHQTINNYPYPYVKTNPICFMFEDSYNCLWVKPNNGKFAYFDKKNNRFVTMEDLEIFQNACGESPESYLIDMHKNLWYSNGDGFYYISFFQKSYEMISEEGQGEVRSIMEDRQKRIWLFWKWKNKDYNGNIRIYNETGNYIGNLTRSGQITTNKNICFGANIYCSFEDKEHNIWLGSRNDGLFLLQPQNKGYKVTQYQNNQANPYSISSQAIYSIIQDRKGRIWIGCFDGGLNLIEKTPNGIRFINANNRLKSFSMKIGKRIRCLYQCANGTILAGTTNGLLSFSDNFKRPEDIHFYINSSNGNSNCLANNEIYSICQDKTGYVYVATFSGGINKTSQNELLSEKAQFKYIDKSSGLSSDITISAVTDHKGTLWFTSERDFSMYNPQNKHLENFNKSFFKNTLKISECCPLVSKDGKIYFGTYEGALCINPAKIRKSTFVPSIIYSKVEIYTPKGLRSESLYIRNGELYLNKEERNIVIQFAALDYMDSPAIKYAYRLKGQNNNWINIGKNHSANLSNLKAGDNIFQIRSTNADGVWTNNISTLKIIVAPTFWETPWAWIVYILIFISLLLITLRITLGIINLRHRVEMEEKLADMKLSFFTELSHELRTPLTLIEGPVEEILDKEPLSTQAHEYLATVQNNAHRMLNIVNQILDIRKIQDDKMKVYIQQVDIVDLVKKIYQDFHPIANERNMIFEFICNKEKYMIYTDVDKVEKILFNLLSNAFKYTEIGKSIKLSLSCNEENFSLQVSDEGCGINLNKINQLFNFFEMGLNANPKKSSGIGLAFIKKLVELMHGNIAVDSHINKGTTFNVLLPCKYDVFKEEKNVEFILNDVDISYTKPEEADTEQTAQKNISILVIEDNIELRHFILNVLKDEYQVFEAENGKIGLQVCSSQLPDIVISDIMMPEMTGIEYLKAAKSDNNICHIPVILLSAKSALDNIINGLEYGADDYITKPFCVSFLKAKITALIKRRQTLYKYYVQQQNISLTEKSTSSSQMTRFDEEFMRKVVQSTEENLDNADFKIDVLADSMNMSRAVFYRKFKSIIGISPIEFVIKKRIKRAEQLIQSEEYSISEIAYMSGFASPQYFNRVFKGIMGCTPKEFKKQQSTVS
jgi:Signal transduction histidine kinase